MKGDCNICANGKLPDMSRTCAECGLSRKNYKPMTNADRIRAMSDEELAELFASWIQDCGCNNVPCHEPCKKKIDAFEAAPCEKNWLDWLREESTT